jgi:hypothetical protein
MESKKFLIVLILRILETESDKTKPLTQLQILDKITGVYPCDRKTVGRNLKFLKEVGFPIVKTPKGFYMDNKTFDREEIDFVLDLVKKSNLEEGKKEDLLGRLYECLSRYYLTN